MKRKSLILIAFLLIPLVFVMSNSSVTILTEPNMTKEFTVSDDWYNTDWNYRRSITLTMASGVAGTDYPVLVEVTYDSDMQVDFDDVIFVDNDHDTLFDFWLENKTDSVTATFWVKVDDYQDSNSALDIYMYFGNNEASTTSNGTAVFYFFDDFENNDFDRWDSAEAGWSIVSDRVQYGTYAAFANSNSGNYGDGIEYNFTSAITTDFMVHVHVNTQTEGGTMKSPILMGSDNLYTSTDYIYILEDDIVHFNDVDYIDYATGTFDDDTWYRLELAVDVSASEGTMFQDRVQKNKITLADRDAGTVNGLGTVRPRCDNHESEDYWLDDFYVRKWVIVEPEIDSWGEKEQYQIPVWATIGVANIMIVIATYTEILDALLILGGMLMIPASALYLVNGGTKEMSQDKLFYGLIAFAIGWALLLGGIS